jgi:hypothetical protein
MSGLILKSTLPGSECYVHGLIGMIFTLIDLEHSLLINLTAHPIPMKPQDNYTTLSLTPYSKPKQKGLMKRPLKSKYHSSCAPTQGAPTLRLGPEAQR